MIKEKMIGDYPAHTPQYPSYGVNNFLTCEMCKLGMQGFDKIFRSKSSIDIIQTVVDIICSDYVMKVNNTVCAGAVKEMSDIIVPVLV